MDDSTKSDLFDLLPELYGPKDRHLPPGGLCTPGSGCGPASDRDHLDILNILTGSNTAPPQRAEGTGRTPESTLK